MQIVLFSQATCVLVLPPAPLSQSVAPARWWWTARRAWTSCLALLSLLRRKVRRADGEQKHICHLLKRKTPLSTLCARLQSTEWSPTCAASGCVATALAPDRPSDEGPPAVSPTSWRPPRSPDLHPAKSPSLPPSPACPSSSLQVDANESRSVFLMRKTRI